jgi:hypothetical protein
MAADPRLAELAKSLQEAVTTVPGTTNVELRKKILERAACGVRRERGPDLPDLQEVVDAVAQLPHGANLEALSQRGLSEDAIFEVVVTAAVGAGYAQVEKALALLTGTER